MHLAGILVAEERGGLSQTHGQVTVGALAVEIDLILERAGHGTQGEAFLFLIIRIAENEHAVQIVIPVTGNTVKVALGHQRRLGKQVAALLLGIFDPALQNLNDARSLGQQDGQTLTDAVNGGEILQLAAKLVVVALERFLALPDVLVQLLLLRERHGVDTLEHLALGVAAPVCAAALRELDGVALDAPGGIEVRSGAQVGELALLVKADHGVLGQIVDQLHLIGFFLLLHKPDGFLTGQLKAFELELFLADLAHLGFERVQMLLREVERRVKVIVEAAVDARTDGELDVGVQALDGLCEDVGAGMPVGTAILFVFKGVQVFFGHGFFSFSDLGADKNPTPEWFRGGILSIPRFHPAYGVCAVARVLCNGRSRPACFAGGSGVVQPMRFAERSHQMRSSLRNASRFLPRQSCF